MFIAASNGIARIIRAFIPLLLDLYKPFFRLLSFFLSLMLPILPPNIALSRDAAAALRAQKKPRILRGSLVQYAEGVSARGKNHRI